MRPSKREQVNYVLECFKSMHASSEALVKEKKRLETDDGYLQEWLETTDFVPAKEPWVWNLLRRFGL